MLVRKCKLYHYSFVRLGEYDTMTTSDGPTTDIAVMSIYYGPFGQDIAVLKLAEEVTTYSGYYTSHIPKIVIVKTKEHKLKLIICY